MLDERIIDIKLLPEWGTPDMRSRIGACLQKAVALRSAVAYWTVPPAFVHSVLCDRLKAPNGFLCVDLHLPTDIDQLAELVRRKADVRIYCEDITTHRDDGRKEPPYLIHSKFLLFWSSDRTAEILVGSHNWTRRALIGLNVESSVAIRMHDTATLFTDAVQYLERIKSVCEPFDLGRIDYYKQLQKAMSEQTVGCIEIEASDAGSLSPSVVTVFGTDTDELKEVGALQKVYLSAFDESGASEYLYAARVMHSGVMGAYSSSAAGLTFSPRRFAYRHGRKFPKLLAASEISDDVLQNAKYFVVLDIESPKKGFVALDPPSRTDAWDSVQPEESPLLVRLNAEQQRDLFGDRSPIVRRPVGEQLTLPKPVFLQERRILAEHRLIVRKILRPEHGG